MAEATTRDVMNFRVPRPVKRRVERYARKYGMSMAAAAGSLMVKGLDAERFEVDPATSTTDE